MQAVTRLARAGPTQRPTTRHLPHPLPTPSSQQLTIEIADPEHVVKFVREVEPRISDRAHRLAQNLLMARNGVVKVW